MGNSTLGISAASAEKLQDQHHLSDIQKLSIDAGKKIWKIKNKPQAPSPLRLIGSRDVWVVVQTRVRFFHFGPQTSRAPL